MERLQAMANLAMRPVIVISASEPVEAERQARAASAVAFFSKPIDLDGFVETVRGQL
jgi:DNA-binding NtrC family response regulator